MKRLLIGHSRLFISILVGLGAAFLLPAGWHRVTRVIAAWDIGAFCFLVLCAALFLQAPPSRMAANAAAQEEGEWTLFWLVLGGTTISFLAILREFGLIKTAPPGQRGLHVALVAGTLVLSWLLAQTAFALRYAHEYYSRAPGSTELDGGLEFPGEKLPDYWDFTYFAVVLGMTFQVSDVQITARKFRRLATVHGLLGFMFNTVIIALTVNLASGLL